MMSGAKIHIVTTDPKTWFRHVRALEPGDIVELHHKLRVTRYEARPIAQLGQLSIADTLRKMGFRSTMLVRTRGPEVPEFERAWFGAHRNSRSKH